MAVLYHCVLLGGFGQEKGLMISDTLSRGLLLGGTVLAFAQLGILLATYLFLACKDRSFPTLRRCDQVFRRVRRWYYGVNALMYGLFAAALLGDTFPCVLLGALSLFHLLLMAWDFFKPPTVEARPRDI
jgi:hypothetical protein